MPSPNGDTQQAVTALYQDHALGLTRIALLMLGDRADADAVVQDAFLGLYRRWDKIGDSDKALAYARSSVLNGCRDVLRKRSRKLPVALVDVNMESAEARALLGEEHREVLTALRHLPDRQREAVVLRHCLGLPEAEVAAAMNVSRGTVKSTCHRGLATLAKLLKEDQ